MKLCYSVLIATLFCSCNEDVLSSEYRQENLLRTACQQNSTNKALELLNEGAAGQIAEFEYLLPNTSEGEELLIRIIQNSGHQHWYPFNNYPPGFFCIERGWKKALATILQKVTAEENNLFNTNNLLYDVVECYIHAHSAEQQVNCIECAQVLLNQHININYTNPDRRETALFYLLSDALKKMIKRDDLVIMLLQNGVDVTLKAPRNHYIFPGATILDLLSAQPELLEFVKDNNIPLPATQPIDWNNEDIPLTEKICRYYLQNVYAAEDRELDITLPEPEIFEHIVPILALHDNPYKQEAAYNSVVEMGLRIMFAINKEKTEEIIKAMPQWQAFYTGQWTDAFSPIVSAIIASQSTDILTAEQIKHIINKLVSIQDYKNAGTVLALLTHYPGEEEFLQQFISPQADKLLQLAALNIILERNRLPIADLDVLIKWLKLHPIQDAQKGLKIDEIMYDLSTAETETQIIVAKKMLQFLAPEAFERMQLSL